MALDNIGGSWLQICEIVGDLTETMSLVVVWGGGGGGGGNECPTRACTHKKEGERLVKVQVSRVG